MEIRKGMKQLLKGAATGTSIAALLALGVPAASAQGPDMDSEPLESGYEVSSPEAGCGGKEDKKKDDKADKKDDKADKKDDKKKVEKGKKEGKCGEGKCG